MMVLGAAIGLLAGCSTTSPSTSPATSQTKSVSPVCAASDAFSASLTNFKDTLKPGATVEQIQSARDQVKKAYDDLLNAAGDAAKERVDAVKAAQQKFASAVNAVPDSATLSQAVNSLRDEAANVQAAVSDLSNEVKC
jgi:cytochrome c556